MRIIVLKNQLSRPCFVILIILLTAGYCLAAGDDNKTVEIPEFNANDRVLILAPHPDDEAIGAGGVIQRALKAGANVKVVFFTNGDNNQLAFIVYEKRLTIRRGEFLYMGGVRRNESIMAMAALGLKKNNLVFLGYPDFGTMAILTKYWGNTRPFKSMFARVTKVSYSHAMSQNAPYVGESILNDLETVILDFKPNKVFVSHPADTNRDHRALYLFLHIALWDLAGRIDPPDIFPYIIHVVGWLKPKGYYPDQELTPPAILQEIPWKRFTLTDEEIKQKHDILIGYKSQNKYDPSFLFSFARKNELFGDFPPIRLREISGGEHIIWQDVSILQDLEAYPEDSGEKKNNRFVSSLAYARQEDELLIRLMLRRKISRNFGISIFLLGYNTAVPFSEMPKLHLSINMLGLHLKDKKQPLFVKGIRMKYQGRALVVRIPLKKLGSPQRILVSARTNVRDLPYDDTAWRIIELQS